MADDTTDTAAGSHPDTVKINEDGSVDTGGRRGWVWCTDTATGHRFDYPSHRLPRHGVEPVAGVPVNYQPTARTAKPFTGKDGQYAAPQVKETAGAPPLSVDTPQAALVQTAPPPAPAPSSPEQPAAETAGTADPATTTVAGSDDSTTRKARR